MSADTPAPRRDGATDLRQWQDETGLELTGAFSFGDEPTMADELIDVVRSGTKRATAGSVEEQRAAGEPDPRPGQRWGLLDGSGRLRFVMETVDVSYGPLASVTPAFAWDEGEDDRTVESWLDTHRRFFSRRGAEDPDRLELCFERFRIVWPESDTTPWLTPDVRPLAWHERDWFRALHERRCSTTSMVIRGVRHEVAELPGLVCERDGARLGVVTFRPRPGGETEVVTLDAFERGIGVGPALTEGLRELAHRSGWRRVWLITTNDNTAALRAYQRVGWELVAVHHGSIDAARANGRSIPTTGFDGIPIRSELELELDLGPGLEFELDLDLR